MDRLKKFNQIKIEVWTTISGKDSKKKDEFAEALRDLLSVHHPKLSVNEFTFQCHVKEIKAQTFTKPHN